MNPLSVEDNIWASRNLSSRINLITQTTRSAWSWHFGLKVNAYRVTAEDFGVNSCRFSFKRVCTDLHTELRTALPTDTTPNHPLFTFCEVINLQHFGLVGPGGTMTPKFKLGRDFSAVQCNASFIVLCLIIWKLSCWLTNPQTHPQTNSFGQKHPTSLCYASGELQTMASPSSPLVFTHSLSH